VPKFLATRLATKVQVTNNVQEKIVVSSRLASGIGKNSVAI